MKLLVYKEEITMTDLLTVTVCGGGSGGISMAADLSLPGCEVNLYEFPDFKQNLDPIRENGGILLKCNTFFGKTGLARLNRITYLPEEVIEDTELIGRL
jgi:hypothetical protein